MAIAVICGLSKQQIASAIKKFKALEHRLEYVATIDGVPLYNDSKATNPESSIKALQAFKEKIVLIAGGRDKGTNLEEFSKVVRNQAAAVILLGEAKERFAEAFKKAGVERVYMIDSMREAIELGLRLKLGPLVLSPACASYDMFKNFEERGNVFKDIIHTKWAQVGQPS
jgi:UDP-N-acetylmuramoylalanine--D-glutamate ligase